MGNMNHSVIKVFPAERDHLQEIREFVRSQAEAVSATTSEIGDLTLAVDEAATNIIVHGYREQPGVIEVEIQTFDGKIVTILRDYAPSFDPTRILPPNTQLPLDLRPIGGLGLHLIRMCTDCVIHLDKQDGGNELVLVKFLGNTRDRNQSSDDPEN